MTQALLTRDEWKDITTRSNLRGMVVLLWIWGSTAALFVAAAMWPIWPVFLMVLFLLGGRQQGLAALMHEAGHHTLFKSRLMNKIVLDWLSSPFLLLDGKSYARCHLEHHRHAGTEHDPDLPNYRSYPVTRISLIRKFTRDFLGITGIKAMAYLIFSGNDLLTRERRAPGQLLKGIFVNVILFLILDLFGYGYLIWLWFIAYFTVYMAVIRMRQIAEHGAVRDLLSTEPKYNTRSLPAGLLGFLFISPTDGLSYHCEHHMNMGVPTYHLRKFHRLLVKKGYYDDIPLANSYRDVLREVVRT